MSQKEVVDNVKLLESIEEIMQPVRLEYVQLKRSLDAIQMKYDNILYEHEEDLDQTELTVENQVKAFLKSHFNFSFIQISRFYAFVFGQPKTYNISHEFLEIVAIYLGTV